MDVAGFRRLFRTVLLSSGSAALAGCGSETDMPERVECIRFDAPDRYARLTVAPGIDGIAFATLGQDVRLTAIGSPCARAANSDACKRRVAELLSEHNEAAAVIAFDQLLADLEALRAPEPLRRRVVRARADEIEHAAVTEALARRFGRRPPAPRLAAPSRALHVDDTYRLAIENATEGCVREAYGALIAAFQSARSEDAEVRMRFAKIAREEAEHAELSFALDRWLATRLSPSERASVARAKAQAYDDLDASLSEPPEEVQRIAGVPSAAQNRILIQRLRREASTVSQGLLVVRGADGWAPV